MSQTDEIRASGAEQSTAIIFADSTSCLVRKRQIHPGRLEVLRRTWATSVHAAEWPPQNGHVAPATVDRATADACTPAAR